MKFLIRIALISLCFFSVDGRAQHFEPVALDTLGEGEDAIVVFSDHTWEYVEDLGFDGILNPELHTTIVNDTNYGYMLSWDNNVPYTYDNDLSTMKDSLWLCLVDGDHPGYCVPVPGGIISTFKYRGRRFHHGIDIDLEVGDSVLSAFDGKVRYAQYNKGGYGNLVIIRHYNGLETYYAHLEKIMVAPNQRVRAGQLIGLGGQTGRAYGPHLHFECRFYHNALDPEEVFDFEAKTLRDPNLIIDKELFDYKAVSGRDKVLAIRSKGTSQDLEDVKYHRVRSGDSLWKISRLYGTSVGELCRLNNIKETTTLDVGQVLKVR